MAVIRSGTGGSRKVRVLRNPGVARALAAWDERLADARTNARDELASEQADRLREAEAAVATARQERDRALERARAEQAERWDELLGRLAALLDGAAAIEGRCVRAAEAEIAGMALAVAARILRREIDAGTGEWVEAAVREALAQVPERRRIVVRMNREDAAVAEERIAAVAPRMGVEPPRVVGDSHLERGSLVVESAGTVIDAGLGAAWRRLAEAIGAELPPRDWEYRPGRFASAVADEADASPPAGDPDQAAEAGSDPGAAGPPVAPVDAEEPEP